MEIELTARVHALPPEIFNQILNDVLTPDVSKVFRIGSAFKLPQQLHIDRFTRRRTAEPIFQGATIIFATSELPIGFVKNLDIALLKLIDRFVVKFSTGDVTDKDLQRNHEFYELLVRGGLRLCPYWRKAGWIGCEPDWIDEDDDSERAKVFVLCQRRN